MTWMTRETFDRLNLELERLTSEDLPNTVAAISASRAEGDLSENSAYHAAREAQGQVEIRIRDINAILSGAEIGTQPPTDQAGAGTVVEVDFGDGDIERFLIGSREDRGSASLAVYSPSSPIGAAVVGLKPGDTGTYQTPSGVSTSFKLLSVSAYS